MQKIALNLILRAMGAEQRRAAAGSHFAAGLPTKLRDGKEDTTPISKSVMA
jgi:hypothetical protein